LPGRLGGRKIPGVPPIVAHGSGVRITVSGVTKTMVRVTFGGGTRGGGEDDAGDMAGGGQKCAYAGNHLWQRSW